MGFYPYAFLPSHAVFLIVPSLKLAAAETAAVNREVGFDGTKRTSRVSNQALEDRRERGILEEPVHRHARNLFRRLPVSVCVLEVASRTPAAEHAVDLHGHREQPVLHRVRLAAPRLFLRFRLWHAASQLEKQLLETVLLRGLREVVRSPVLLVSPRQA